MRKKIRELMKKEEGFTLVELLAVIVILGIIVAIAVPAIGNVMDRADAGAKESEAELVIDAAQLYYTATEETAESVDVSTLVSQGYLENTPEHNTATKVTREFDGSAYVYTFGEFSSGGTASTPPADTDDDTNDPA